MMKVLLRSASALGLGLAALTLTPHAAMAESAFEDIEKTGTLRVAIREDSPLFGFGPEKIGYCNDFATALAAGLSERMGKTIDLTLVTSVTQTRWTLVSEGRVHFECGPNSITPDREARYNVVFSDPFFATATQIFTQADSTAEDLLEGTIGTISGTTNADEIQAFYPSSQIDSTYLNRQQGIAAVRLGEISGFASDGILLVGTAQSLGIAPESFALATPEIIETSRPFCAVYGMILPAGEENKVWRAAVNAAIAKSTKGVAIWDSWFVQTMPYLESVFKSCWPGALE